MKKPDRFIPLHVAQLMRVVVGDEEQAMALPFEGLFGFSLCLPDRRESPAVSHVYDFIQGELDWRQSLAWRNLRNPG